MKKLVIIAAACSMALMSQAYEYKWNVTGVKVPVADNVKVSQAVVAVGAENANFDAGALTMSLFWVNDSTDNLIAELSNDKAGMLSATTVFTDESSDAFYKAIKAVFGVDQAIPLKMTASYTTADGTYNYVATMNGKALEELASGNVTAKFAMPTAGTWSYTANAVPEPTSGLLLILGVAGLALRRRRA